MKQKGSFIVLAVLIMTSIRSQYEKKKVFNDIELARNANAEWTFFLMTCISSASSAFHHREWICRVFANFVIAPYFY